MWYNYPIHIIFGILTANTLTTRYNVIRYIFVGQTEVFAKLTFCGISTWISDQFGV